MRLRSADLRGCVKANLALRFTRAGLTSYAGLELVRRYFRQLGLAEQLRRHLTGRVPATDYGILDGPRAARAPDRRPAPRLGARADAVLQSDESTGAGGAVVDALAHRLSSRLGTVSPPYRGKWSRDSNLGLPPYPR